MPDYYPTTSYQQPYRPSSGGVSGGDMSPEELQRYDDYAARARKLYDDSSGWDREKERLRYEDAVKGRDNAYAIANLQAKSNRYGTDKQAETSRYGADVQAQTSRYGVDKQADTSRYSTDQQVQQEILTRQQAQKQFDANHGLEFAKTYAQYSQSPDQMFARNDLMFGLDRVGQGLAPISSVNNGSMPQRGNWQDFAALAGYGGVPTVAAGQTAVSGGGDGGGAQAGGGASQGTDPRLTAANAVMKAIPPSGDPGTDGQDWSALGAIYHLYSAGQPGSVERLGSARTKIAQAGLARMGLDPATVTQDYQRAGVGQGSSRAA